MRSVRWTALLVVVLFLTGACGAADPTARGRSARAPAASSTSSDPSAAPSSPSEPWHLASGVTLLPGADGSMPVRPRWVHTLCCPEAMGLAGGTLYVADELLDAIAVSDGSIRWEAGAPQDEGLNADGGVVVGLVGRTRVRAWAPWNYDIVADRSTGRVAHFTWLTRDRRPPLRALRGPKPRRYEVHAGLRRIVARTADGSVAWQITVDDPQFDALPPIEVAGGVIISASDGSIIALDYV